MVTHKYLGWILLLLTAHRICTIAHLMKSIRWMSKIGKSRPILVPKYPKFYQKALYLKFHSFM